MINTAQGNRISPQVIRLPLPRLCNCPRSALRQPLPFLPLFGPRGYPGDGVQCRSRHCFEAYNETVLAMHSRNRFLVLTLLVGAACSRAPVVDLRALYKGAAAGDSAAMAQLTTLASKGDATAQAHLGLLYASGEGVAKDAGLAFSWYRKAAEQGDIAGQSNLGNLYAEGQGVPKDTEQAMLWWKRAAERGDKNAQYNLGLAYNIGEWVPKDPMQAVIWWRKAADQGDMDAQYELGVLYQKGEGVPKDLVLAYMWENLAAAQGEEEARKLRNALERSMTLEQVGEAQKFSRNWKPATSGSAPLVARTQSSEGQGDRP